MNEQTPLLDDEYDLDEHWIRDKKTRWVLYGAGGVFGIFVLWAFAFYLPLHFIPESRPFDGIQLVKDLNVVFEPITPEDSQKQFEPSYSLTARKESKQRLILIGDVHGHYQPFKNLLKKVNFNNKTDHLLLLGDFITKGPHSIKMLDYLIEHKIDCIIGNHEYYVMNNYARFHNLDPPYFIGSEDGNKNVFETSGGFNDDPEYLLAKKLQPHHIEYINQCAVIKTLGPVPQHKTSNEGSHKYSDGIAVHGGLRWDIPDLEEQPAVECLEMRSLIGPFFNESTDDPRADRAVLWSKIWNLKQKEKNGTDTQVVYYGHDARRGLNLKRFAKGLDSGCDTGGELSAMVIWQEKARKRVVYKEQVVQVRCDD